MRSENETNRGSDGRRGVGMIRVKFDTEEGSAHVSITADTVKAIMEEGITFNPRWEGTIYDLLMAGF